jgi:hypothetical protein
MDFAQVLNEELGLIGTRRRRVRALAPQPPAPAPATGTEAETGEEPGDGLAAVGAGQVLGQLATPDGHPVVPDAGPALDRPGDAAGRTAEQPAPLGAPTNGPTAPAAPAAPTTAAIPGAAEPDDRQKQARLAALDRHLAGLAISGGGIRSATFAMGVLQGLADLKLLSRFDYLSTVSGGGYIGGWLAAWIKRQGNPLDVEKQLAPSRIVQARSDDRDRLIRSPLPEGRIVDEEPEPIHHLRSYSNYLTPRPGLLSVDTWTVLTIYVRNALINLLLLLPITMMAVLLGRAVVWCYSQQQAAPALRWSALGTLAALLGLGFVSMGWHVNYILSVSARCPGQPSRWGGGQAWMGVTMPATILAPLVVAAALACWVFTPAPTVPDARDGPAAVVDPADLRLPKSMATAGDGSRGGWLHEVATGISGLLFDLRDEYHDAGSDPRGALLYTALAYGLVFGILTLMTHLLGYVIRCASGLDPDTIARQRGQDRSRLMGVIWMSLAAFIAGFNGGFFFFAAVSLVLWPLAGEPYAVATIGPPLALLVVVGATFVEVWLLGRWQGDELREWWARICAWLVILAAAWLSFFGVTLYGPMAAYSMIHPAVKHGLAASWLVTAAGGAWAGRRPESRREVKAGAGGLLIKLLAGIAPTVFVLGLMVAVAMLVDALVFDRRPISAAPEVAGGVVAPAGAVVHPAHREYWHWIMTTPIDRIGMVMAVCAVLATVAAVMSNVNLFSLNSMYAERLIRCYLGASRRKREWGRRGNAWATGAGGAPTGVTGPPRSANPVTGFDPDDDIPLWKMKIGDGTRDGGLATPGEAETYLGPHHIINTALNLVSGRELAWQDRKAESFILTPAHCGSAGTGYAPTTPPTGRELTLGRAMSISGAAVDSNIGLQQSSALIALMTAFNARLGWWMRNPNPATWRLRWLPWNAGGAGWDAGSPSLALPLLLELVGLTNETQEYVHLSDGGHFENLAVYELVRRRCRYIVCCDAGTDPGASDDNLANVVRLCRTDFGVRIEIDTAPFARRGNDRLSRWHCAVGRIRYDDVDGGERPGIFVYLRTSMTGDEPPDVQQYAATHPAFPFESTLDQFFDEPQFESYRALGFHVAQSAFKEALDDVEDVEPLWSNRDAELEFRRGNQRLFSSMQRRWSPSPDAEDPAAQRAQDSWAALQEALRTDGDLVPLSRALYPELASSAAAGVSVPQVHAVAQLIQAMEGAWLDLKQSGFRDLPMNRGWMGVFRRWSCAPAVRRLWPILRGEYRQDFVKFCEDQLELGARVDAVDRHRLDARYVAESMALLGDEFAREWPDQPSLADLVADAERDWAGWSRAQPISMIVQAPPGDAPAAGSPGRVACGIVFLTRVAPPDPARRLPGRFELFVWLRRAYRGLGIASRCARSILTGYRATVPDGLHRPFVLQARYPAAPGEDADTRKDEAEYLLWLNFFGHYDFRCPRGEPPIRCGYWVIERTFQPDELEP